MGWMPMNRTCFRPAPASAANSTSDAMTMNALAFMVAIIPPRSGGEASHAVPRSTTPVKLLRGLDLRGNFKGLDDVVLLGGQLATQCHCLVDGSVTRNGNDDR